MQIQDFARGRAWASSRSFLACEYSRLSPLRETHVSRTSLPRGTPGGEKRGEMHVLHCRLRLFNFSIRQTDTE